MLLRIGMGGAGVHFSQFGGPRSSGAGPTGREIQELWFSLSKRRWSSLALVPADAEFSVGSLATSLADVGGRLRDTPVTAIVAESVDYESVRMLTDLQLRVTDTRVWKDAVDVQGSIIATSTEVRLDDAPPAPATPPPRVGQAIPMPPVGQVVLALPPVVVEPLGVAIAQAADAVVLCIRVGVTRLKVARRTIELIGADRVTGAFLIR